MIQVELQIHNVNKRKDEILTLIHLYRDSTSSRITFLQELQQILTTIPGNVMLIGDINIDILDEFKAAEYLNMI